MFIRLKNHMIAENNLSNPIWAMIQTRICRVCSIQCVIFVGFRGFSVFFEYRTLKMFRNDIELRLLIIIPLCLFKIGAEF